MFARRPLPVITIAYASGILCADCAPALLWGVAAFSLFALVLWGAGRRSLALPLLLSCAFLFLGACRFRSANPLLANDISRFAPANVIATGVVRTDVEFPRVAQSAPSTQFGSCLFAVRQVEINDRAARHLFNVAGEVLFRLPLNVTNGQGRVSGGSPVVGDVLRVRGLLDLPSEQRNPGGFDVRAWLARRNIGAILTVHHRQDWRVMGRERAPSDILLARLRYAVLDHWRHALTWEQAGVMEAALIGAKIDLPRQAAEDFERTGMMHLLATAGLHVGLLAALVLALARTAHMPRRAGWLLTISVLILYAMLAGGRPSVVRAMIVAVVMLLGSLLEREPDLPNALSVAAFGLLLYDPRNLSDPGFQLSFATVITIVLLMPFAEPALRRIVHRGENGPVTTSVRRMRRGLQLAAAALFLAVAAQIGSAPLVAYYFNTLSPVATLANTLVVPFMPVLLACGFCGTAAGAVFAPLAMPFDVATRWLVGYAVGVSHRCAGLPFASLSVMSPPVAMVVAYYGIVWGLAWWMGRSAGERDGSDASKFAPLPEPIDDSDRAPHSPIVFGSAVLVQHPILLLPALLIGGHLLLLGWNAIACRHEGVLRVTFLDVGQGDAAVIETPSGKTIVVDTGGVGAGSGEDEGYRVVLPFLRSHGIDRIDAVVLTHPHADHIGGATTLLRRMRVDRMIDNGQDVGDAELSGLLAAAQDRGVPRQAAGPGRTIDCGDGVTLEELAPNKAEMSGQANNASIVLRLTYGRTTFLLTGDAEASEEGDLLQSGSHVECDVLKVGHHGSRTSTTAEFLSAAHPRWAVVSVGKHNLYGHPNTEVVSRLQSSGAKVYRTDVSGALIFLSNGVVVNPYPLYQ